MASNIRSAYGYTAVYVQDVSKSVTFYAEDFGCDVLCVHESNRWGELESGETTIAFTPMHQHETDDLTGKRAIEKGAVEVREPEETEWGQKVGFVRDIDGIVVRMGSRLNPSP